MSSKSKKNYFKSKTYGILALKTGTLAIVASLLFNELAIPNASKIEEECYELIQQPQNNVSDSIETISVNKCVQNKIEEVTEAKKKTSGRLLGFGIAASMIGFIIIRSGKRSLSERSDNPSLPNRML